MYLHFAAPFLKFSPEGAWIERVSKLQTCRAKISLETENPDFDCISIVYSNPMMSDTRKAAAATRSYRSNPITDSKFTLNDFAHWDDLLRWLRDSIFNTWINCDSVFGAADSLCSFY